MNVGRLISVYGRSRLYFPAKFALLLVVEISDYDDLFSS
jgi:hypothetical protein